MGHVFISYSRKDLGYAVKLSRKLRREGFDPWLDVDRLKAGTSWQERLHTGVEACDAYVLILSPNSRKSKWVENELLTAQNLGKPIFPILIEDTRTFLAIQTIQYQDVRGTPVALPSEEFYERLARYTMRLTKLENSDELLGLSDEERDKKAEVVAEQASSVINRIANTVGDTMAVAARAGRKILKAVAANRAMKKKLSKPRSKPRANLKRKSRSGKK